MFGGQSHVNFDNDLGKFVASTREEIVEEYRIFRDTFDSDESFDAYIESKVEKDVRQAMQAVVYNLNTMHSRAGSQVPFSSLNIGLPENDDAAMVCRIFLEEYDKGLGNGEQPIFPNIIFRVKKGVNRGEGAPYEYLFKLACKVASHRMNPTFMNMDADFNLKYYKKGILPATMGCRTYVCSNINGPEGPARRGNNAPVTMDIVRMALEANKNINKFYDLLDKYITMAIDSCLYRHEVLCELKVKDLPFVAGEKLMMGSENLGPDDSIEPILKNGTYGIGFVGLAECVYAITGKKYGLDKEATEVGFNIVSYIRKRTDEATEKYHLNFGCYASPAETVCGKLLKADREDFGIVEGVTDKDYFTNSFHVPVSTNISIVDKINVEAPFHKLCNSGHITYIELDGYPDAKNVEKIINYAYDNSNISYMGINFHLRYCKDCGQVVVENAYQCPKCGSTKIQGISRVTGYLSLDERFGEAKVQERSDRISHDSQTKRYISVNK